MDKKRKVTHRANIKMSQIPKWQTIPKYTVKTTTETTVKIICQSIL